MTKDLFFKIFNIGLIMLVSVFAIIMYVPEASAYDFYEDWSGSIGVNTGYNTNEFSLDGAGEVGYGDFGVEAGGHYVHNNMMYGYTGLNYYPNNHLSLGIGYDYYPESESRNSKYTSLEQYNAGVGYDFGYATVDTEYSWGTDGDWLNTTVYHEIDNGWGTYGYYNHSFDDYDDRIGVGIKYSYKK